MARDCSEKAQIIYQLNDVYKWMSPKFEQCTGISQARLDLLHVLFEVDEINQRALQREAGIDHSAITRHLKQLELKGMVSRRKNPDDYRVTLVRLTKDGRDRIQSFKQEKHQFVEKVFQDFTEQDIQQLSVQLTKIQQNVKNITVKKGVLNHE
ncbi:MarR family winged helix-turn-helix transcriptional regulator [Jeotgalibacillus sp. R-1-5s-1]|uniref:MarR family winged helix-turn-helix transcriptional regulator n=1 Tax=Jeotgalibacillus sp. R-1-5s-1 TaxID=2555897 RepID=UPI00106AD160|nr:MarR family transcriptional regulator [Jeotgalibacillus sp. R-1-5s-1]TFD94447.1 MarR family transcriptional regulator [Jeotgalibacillus sp. R-1-5s-1]